MRDIKRIDKFCTELAEVWKKECPDWRFGQFICNVMGGVSAKHGDIWFPEEDSMMSYVKEYFQDIKTSVAKDNDAK